MRSAFCSNDLGPHMSYIAYTPHSQALCRGACNPAPAHDAFTPGRRRSPGANPNQRTLPPRPLLLSARRKLHPIILTLRHYTPPPGTLRDSNRYADPQLNAEGGGGTKVLAETAHHFTDPAGKFMAMGVSSLEGPVKPVGIPYPVLSAELLGPGSAPGTPNNVSLEMKDRWVTSRNRDA